MTKYVVITLPKPLGQNSVSAAPPQLAIDEVDAASANAAIRQIAEKKGSGTYVAVPKRSWQPQTVEVKQETKVSFGSDS